MKKATAKEIEKAMNEYYRDIVIVARNNAARSHIAGDIKGHHRLKLIDIDFNLVHAEALIYSKKYGKMLIKEGASMIQEGTSPYRYKKVPWLKDNTKRTRKAIFEIIRDGLKEGKPVTEIGGKRIGEGTIAHDLQTFIIRDSDYEYARIARSEVGRIQIEGSKARYKANGIKKVGRLCGPDPCPACAELCGRIFGINKAPGLLHPNCVCDNEPIVERK